MPKKTLKQKANDLKLGVAKRVFGSGKKTKDESKKATAAHADTKRHEVEEETRPHTAPVQTAKEAPKTTSGKPKTVAESQARIEELKKSTLEAAMKRSGVDKEIEKLKEMDAQSASLNAFTNLFTEAPTTSAEAISSVQEQVKEPQVERKASTNTTLQGETKAESSTRSAADKPKFVPREGSPLHKLTMGAAKLAKIAEGHKAASEDVTTKRMDELLKQSTQVNNAADVKSTIADAAALSKEVDKAITTEQKQETKRKSSLEKPEDLVEDALKETQRIETYYAKLQEYLRMAQPINSWKRGHVNPNDSTLPIDRNDFATSWVSDLTTGEQYRDDTLLNLRKKMFFLTLGTCTVNLIALLAHSVYRLAKIITVYELRNRKNSTITNLKNFGGDIARLVFGPLILTGLQITAILGTITPFKNGPHDARKMYGLGEQMLFGFSKDSWRLAPGFRTASVLDESRKKPRNE